MVYRAGAVMAGMLAALAACSSGDDDRLTTRDIHLKIESICASAVDERVIEGGEADPAAFLEAATADDPDNAAAEEAARYNVEALERFLDEIRALQAEDAGDQELLEAGIEGLESRQAMWEARREGLASGSIDLQNEGALTELIDEGSETAVSWYEAMDHFGVDEPDCGRAVP